MSTWYYNLLVSTDWMPVILINTYCFSCYVGRRSIYVLRRCRSHLYADKCLRKY